MPKHNFNTAIIDAHGDAVLRAQIDKNKMKLSPDGRLIPDVIVDDEGYVKQEPVTVAFLLSQILNHIAEGDDADGELRKRKGKLARKVADRTEGAHKNYSVDEMKLITDLAAKFGSTELVAQLDDMLNSDVSEDKAAA